LLIDVLEQGDPKIVALTGEVTSFKSTVVRLDGLMTALERAVARRQALGPFAGGDSVDAIADECTRQPRLLRWPPRHARRSLVHAPAAAA
jgi:hypothetical protein